MPTQSRSGGPQLGPWSEKTAGQNQMLKCVDQLEIQQSIRKSPKTQPGTVALNTQSAPRRRWSDPRLRETTRTRGSPPIGLSERLKVKDARDFVDTEKRTSTISQQSN